MSDDNNAGQPNPGEDSAKAGQPPVTEPPASSSDKHVDPAEQARRDQQSKKDKALSENDELTDRLSWLESREAEREKDTFVGSFLAENKDKYPNVTAEDLKFANTPEDVEAIAKHMQRRFQDQQQDALKSVRLAEDSPLSAEQFAKEAAELEKKTNSESRSTFGEWFSRKEKVR